MVGKNAAELELTAAYSCLHPVFNVSLLMPYTGDRTSSFADPPLLQDNLLLQFVDWASVTYVLDYRCLTTGVHEYLLRGQDSSALNDEWKLLTTLSPHLDIFLRQFHQSTPSRGPGPTNDIWRNRADLLV